MKTLINRYGGVRRPDLTRLSDGDAQRTVKLNYGWEYCPKHVWKERQREQTTSPETQA